MKFIRFAILALLPMLVWNCSDRQDEPDDVPADATGSYLRLTLTVAESSNSRANPSGGEDGDGREDGVNKENDIDNIAIFIYNDPGEGLDSDADTPFEAKVYATRSSMKEENGNLICTLLLDNYTPARTHRAVVVANAGDITSDVNTIGELRTRPATDAWTPGETINQTSTFVMASAFNGARQPSDDGRVHIIHAEAGSETRPNFSASVALERVAARIDIMYSTFATSGLFYTVKSALRSTLFVTDVLPVNLMRHPSYMLKHVTEGADTSTLFVCGDETVDTEGKASNYTITPATLLKNGATPASLLEQWYGTSRAEWIRQHPSEFDKGVNIASLITQQMPLPAPVDGESKYVIIAYANENTQLPEFNDSRFITGLALRAIYRPQKLYTDTDLKHSVPVPTGGRTFWLFRPTRQTMGEDNCVYFASEDVALAYQALNAHLSGTVERFDNGVCYYNLWIRHAGNLCGIVRNNIYRISLSFTGPGHPTPELTEPHNIESRIFVRRWNFRPQSPILM